MSSESSGRDRGRMKKEDYRLTPEQRQVLGVDRFLTIDEIAAILNVSDKTVRAAIDRGKLPAYYATSPLGNRVQAVKGWRVIIWRDELAGLSDGPEENYQKV